MKRALTVVVAVLVAGLAQFSASLAAAPVTATAAGTVKVTIHYTGKGKVDASHKVWVWVFDSPNIGAGSMPMDQISLDKNDTDAVFEGVGIDKVYIAAAFDESGSMMGDAPPPTGTPIGILSGANGAPSSVTSAAKEAVVLTFNDNFRMP